MLTRLCLFLITFNLVNLPLAKKGYYYSNMYLSNKIADLVHNNLPDVEHEKLVRDTQNKCDMYWSKCIKNTTIKVDYSKPMTQQYFEIAKQVKDVCYRSGLVRLQNVIPEHFTELTYLTTCLGVPQYANSFGDIDQTFRKKFHFDADFKVVYVDSVGRFGARLCVKDNDCFDLYTNDMIIVDNRMYPQVFISANVDNNHPEDNLRIRKFQVNRWWNVFCHVGH